MPYFVLVRDMGGQVGEGRKRWGWGGGTGTTKLRGVLFCKLPNGQHFFKCFGLCKREKKSVLVQNTAGRYKASLLTPLLKLALC